MDRSEIISEQIKSLKASVRVQYNLQPDDIESLDTAYGIAHDVYRLLMSELADKSAVIERKKAKDLDTGSETEKE